MQVSLEPSPDADTRRATRLLSMVHELHKAGFQRLRVCPGLSHSDFSWRCLLTPAENMFDDGWSPRSADGTLMYVVEQPNGIFGWDDADSDNARQLAAKFIERYRDFAERCKGSDWAYAGWFTEVLGAAERGQLPFFFIGFEEDDAGPFIAPPPPPDDVKPFRSDPPLIETRDLRSSHLPRPFSRYEEVWPFCLSFDGYLVESQMGANLQQIAEETEQEGYRDCSIDRLRATAFYRQRCAKWSDTIEQVQALLPLMHKPIEKIREQLESREQVAILKDRN